MEDEIAKLKKLVTDPRQSLADQEGFNEESSLKQELEAARRSMAEFQGQERMYLNQIRSIKEMLQQKQVELDEARLSYDAVMNNAAQEEKLNQLGSENSELRLLVQTLRQRLVDQDSSEESENVLALRKENADLKSSFDSRESSLLHELQVQDEIRKHLHNRVMQLTGNMIVFVRVRPAIASEKHSHTDTPFMFPSIHDRDILSPASDEDLTKHSLVVTEPFKDRGGLTPRQKKYKFCFDRVFNPDDTQDSIWTGVEPIVQSAIDGFNVCLFAYGQTGVYCPLESSNFLGCFMLTIVFLLCCA
jgi:kinesin family protein C1